MTLEKVIAGRCGVEGDRREGKRKKLAHSRVLCGLNLGQEQVDCKAAEHFGNFVADFDLGCWK